MPEEYQDEIRQCHVMIGVSRRQPVKCAVCACQDEVVVSFTSVFASCGMQDRFFGFLKEQGALVETESNGVVRQEDNRGSYPEIAYNIDKWKKVINVFYAVMLTLAACLGVINWMTYSGFWWSGIAISRNFVCSCESAVFDYAKCQSGHQDPHRNSGSTGTFDRDRPCSWVSGVVCGLCSTKYDLVCRSGNRIFDPGEPAELAELFYVSDRSDRI